jgi:hypothetical protein
MVLNSILITIKADSLECDVLYKQYLKHFRYLQSRTLQNLCYVHVEVYSKIENYVQFN